MPSWTSVPLGPPVVSMHSLILCVNVVCFGCNFKLLTTRPTFKHYGICPKKVGGRVCDYKHAKDIYNVLTQGRTVQKGGSNRANPQPANHTLLSGCSCQHR